MSIKLAVAIQNHPERKYMAESMVKRVPEATIHIDTEMRGVWIMLREILQQYAESDNSHLCVLQDDVLPCDDFHAQVSRILEIVPDRLFSLFFPLFWATGSSRYLKSPYYAAMGRGDSWLIDRRVWFGAPAIVYPVALLSPMLAWIDEHEGISGFWPSDSIDPRTHMDDVRIHSYLTAQRMDKMVTVPCLVEHLGVHASTIVNSEGRRVNNNAKAFWFNQDVSQIDWKRGL